MVPKTVKVYTTHGNNSRIKNQIICFERLEYWEDIIYLKKKEERIAVSFLAKMLWFTLDNLVKNSVL